MRQQLMVQIVLTTGATDHISLLCVASAAGSPLLPMINHSEVAHVDLI